MSRFDYVRYDEISTDHQGRAKQSVERVEREIDLLPNSRPKSLALTALEECYMWIGKAIRDDQINRGGSDSDVPERGEGSSNASA